MVSEPDLVGITYVMKASKIDLAQLQVDYNEGNRDIIKHPSFWESSNEKLALGYKIQTVHKQL